MSKTLSSLTMTMCPQTLQHTAIYAAELDVFVVTFRCHQCHDAHHAADCRWCYSSCWLHGHVALVLCSRCVVAPAVVIGRLL